MSEERLKEIKDYTDFKMELVLNKEKYIDITLIKELYNEVIRLREENKDYEQLIETQLRGLEKQKQIINKAVEYIEWSNYEMVNDNKKFFNYLDKLLNILRGEDK